MRNWILRMMLRTVFYSLFVVVVVGLMVKAFGSE
jgi:hypothetical protein